VISMSPRRLTPLLLFMTLLSAGGALAQDKGSVNPKPLPPLANPNDPKLGAKELFARKLRQDLAALPKSQRNWETVQRLYNEANDDCADYQARYDNATHHSILQDAQRDWTVRVAQELTKFEAYASR